MTEADMYRMMTQRLTMERDQLRNQLAAVERELEPLRAARHRQTVLVEVAPELLVFDHFTKDPLHVMLTNNGDGTHMLTFRESDELLSLRAHLAALTSEKAVEAAAKALYLRGDLSRWNTWENETWRYKEAYYEDAKAVLAAGETVGEIPPEYLDAAARHAPAPKPPTIPRIVGWPPFSPF